MKTIKDLITRVVLLFLPREQKEVVAVLQSYAAAFLTFKPNNVIGYFDQPLTMLLDTGPEVFDTTEKVTAYLQSYMKNLQDEHYKTDVLTRMRLRTITGNVVVTSFHLVRVNTSGEPFNSMNAMYTWRKTGGQWRVIIGVLLSDGNMSPVPASAPR